MLNWKCQPFFFFVCSLSKDALAQVQHLFSQESEVCTTSYLLHRPTLGVRGVREGMKVSRVLAVSGDRPCSAHLSLSSDMSQGMIHWPWQVEPGRGPEGRNGSHPGTLKANSHSFCGPVGGGGEGGKGPAFLIMPASVSSRDTV